MQQRESRYFHKFGSEVLLRTQRLASKDLALPPGVPPGRARPLDEQAAAEVLSRA